MGAALHVAVEKKAGFASSVTWAAESRRAKAAKISSSASKAARLKIVAPFSLSLLWPVHDDGRRREDRDEQRMTDWGTLSNLEGSPLWQVVGGEGGN
jgi:hypothetical protein